MAVLLAAGLVGCGNGSESSGPVVVVERDGDTLRLVSKTTVGEIRLNPYRLAFSARGASEALTRELDTEGIFYERGGVRHHLTRVAADRVLPDGVELQVETSEGPTAVVTVRFASARTLEVTFSPPVPGTVTALGDHFYSPPDELIYGLTERLRDSPPTLPPATGLETEKEEVWPVEVGSLNRRGETVQMRVRPTIAIYAPFYQSSRGYGLAVAGTALGWFDVADTDADTVSFSFETGNAADSRRLRFHLFHGPGHAAILDEYTALTGRPFVPPDWAFLHWRWRDELALGEPAILDGVAMNADLVEDITKYEQHGIPPGVYLFDRPVLAGEFGFARFAWDEERLPNPHATLDALRRRGYRLATWSSMWACGSDPMDNGAQALELGLLAPGPLAGPECKNLGGQDFILDVTHPDVPEWWADKVADFAAANGIQAIKLDRGEEHIPSEEDDVWADGRNGREVRNAYPVMQAKIHHDAMVRAFGDDALVITRSGYTGTQRWAIVWGGDTAGSESFGLGPGTDLGLRSAIISQQRAAFLGYPIWGSNTGGYYQFKHRDVFARWIEFSAFSGIMDIGGIGPHAPWDMPTEPHFDQEMIDIYRRYTRLRETLQGYIAAAARAGGESGLPVVRPLVFAYPDDEKVRDLWDQYLFGPDLMVAPVWRVDARARQVYFPAGTWRSYWDELQTYEGPGTVTLEVPLDTIPVFVRDGADVPRPPAG